MDIKKIYKDNLEINCEEIKAKRITILSKPQRLTVSLSTKCNLACRMCSVHKMAWEIPRKTIEEIICFFPYLRGIAWHGGEAFLFDSFREILEEASVYPDLVHEIATNGHLLNEEWIQILRKINLNLCISIDSVNKDTYEYIRKGSKFEHLLESLNLINENKKRRDKMLVLSLVVTVMKSNYRELALFVKFAKKYGFDMLFFQPVVGNLDNEENIFYHNDREALSYIQSVKPEIEATAKDCGIMVYEWLSTSPNSKESIIGVNETKTKYNNGKLFCLAPWQQLFVGWEGKIYPHCLCCADELSDQRQIGDVIGSSLSEVWNGEKMGIFRKRIVDNEFSGLCCSNCVSVPDNLRSFNREIAIS